MRYARILPAFLVLMLFPAPLLRAQIDSVIAAADSLFKNSNWKAAAVQYERVLQERPGNGQYHYRLGRCRFNLKLYDKAIPEYRASIAIGHNSVVMFSLAEAFAALGKKDSALTWLETAEANGFGLYSMLASSAFLQRYKEEARFKTISEKLKATAYPCTSRPEARQFDFWIGEWDVTDRANGTPVGSSSVQLILGSCVIFENWTSKGGNDGKSFNVYDTLSRQWQQTWVDDQGTLSIYKGRFADGKMVITTDNQQLAKGSQQMLRMTFTPEKDGSVRQFGEASTDGGSTWKTSYDLVYRRKKSPGKP